MGIKIIILTTLTCFLVVSGKEDVMRDGLRDVTSYIDVAAASSVDFGGVFSDYAITIPSTCGAGTGYMVSKHHKTSVHTSPRRLFRSHQVFSSVSRRDVTRPISDLTGTFRHIIILEKLLI